MIIHDLLKFFKHILTDAHRALRSSPPASPASGRVMLLNRVGGVVPLLAVA